MIGRAIAWSLLVLALIAAGADGVAVYQTGVYTPLALGELWSNTDPESLNMIKVAVERYAGSAVWRSGLVPLLIWPAWAVLASAGLIVGLLLGRGGGRRRRRSSFG
jgi:hypothetical protein